MAAYNIVMFTRLRKLSFSAKATRKCFALSVSSSIQTPSTRSCPSPSKVTTPNTLKNVCIVLEMRRLVREMLEEVDQIDRNNSVCEDLYGKLEQKVRKKFNEEVERLEKSFRRIIEQLEIQ
jgi:hypothetical protein